jgi:hypothetical protein
MAEAQQQLPTAAAQQQPWHQPAQVLSAGRTKTNYISLAY